MKTLQATKIVHEVEAYVSELLDQHLDPAYCYHNLAHTREVVDAVCELGLTWQLTEDEMECVLLAAWFHDVGYIHGAKGHEARGVDMMAAFLGELRYPPARIRVIAGCIQATEWPQNPKGKLEKILCDADLFHLGLQEYFDKAELMRKEIMYVQEREISPEAWLLTNYDFIESHKFFTAQARQLLNEGKQANLDIMTRQMERLKEDEAYMAALQDKYLSLEEYHRSAKEAKTVRGIESMFRITSKNHKDLSELADQKSNIMISVNAILLSVTLSVLVLQMADLTEIILPIVLLTVTCTISITLAVLSTRPNVKRGTFDREDITSRQTNLLFFGNFHNSLLEDYEWGMKEMIKDGEYLYSSMIKDIYFVGKVLAKKYRLLRLCYTVFMVGISLTVGAFIIIQFLK